MKDINQKRLTGNDYSFTSRSESFMDIRNTFNIPNYRLISKGKCSKFYLHILGSALFKLLSLLILGEEGNNFGLFGFSPVLLSYRGMQGLYTYIVYIIFGIICYFCLKSKINNSSILLINDKILENNKRNTYFHIFLTCFSFILWEEVERVLYALDLHLLDFWTFEILFTFLLMKRYFVIDIYKHHKCSIIFICVMCTVLLIIDYSLPDTENKNQFQRISEQLSNNFYFIIIILIFVVLSFIFGFSRNYSKVLMQAKYVSPYILIVFIGVSGLTFIFIVFLISLFTNNSYLQTHLETFNFIKYFETIKELDSKWEKAREFVIIFPSFLFTQFMKIYYEILTIYYLSPIHTLLLNNICFAIQVILFFAMGIDKDVLIFIFSETPELTAIFGYIIYLEILEFNFCGLSKNIRRKIVKKGEEEFHTLSNHMIELAKIEDDEDTFDYGTGKFEEILEKRKKNKE